MKKKQFTTEQIIGILREGNAGGNISAVCRKHGVSNSTYYTRKMRYGDMYTSIALVAAMALPLLLSQ